MKTYHISHMDEETKIRNMLLYMKIYDNGKHIKGEWNGDYWVATYEYDNKIYELWDNMEYGIMSEVVEYSKDEYKQTKKADK